MKKEEHLYKHMLRCFLFVIDRNTYISLTLLCYIIVYFYYNRTNLLDVIYLRCLINYYYICKRERKRWLFHFT